MVVPALFKFGLKTLPEHCKLTPGIPLKPMLAFPTHSISEVLDRFESLSFTCEFKYDGERAQIHRLADGRAFIYSRNSENMTQKYPDIMSKLSLITIPDRSSVSYVLDCEVVAFNTKDHKILPFQTLSTRKRKDVSAESIEVQVCLFAFDILFLDGEPLLEKSFRERRALLYSNFHEVPGEFYFATHMDAQSTESIQQFLEESIQGF